MPRKWRCTMSVRVETRERFRRACERLGTPQSPVLERLVSVWCDVVGEPTVARSECQRIRRGALERPASGVWEF